MKSAEGGRQRLTVDQRSDVYSLGVTLYELLTLEPAFDGKDRKELFQKIIFTAAGIGATARVGG